MDTDELSADLEMGRSLGHPGGPGVTITVLVSERWRQESRRET